MTPVFILSLPRSRTAWLATFFCYGDTYAFHEGLIGCASIEELKTKMEATGKEIVVNSDCGNILFLDRIKEVFPDAKYIVIKRDYNEVADELERLGEPDGGIVKLCADLLEKELTPLVLNYDELNKEACRSMCNYIGIPFDETRWEMLDAFDIQIIPGKKTIYVDQAISLMGA